MLADQALIQLGEYRTNKEYCFNNLIKSAKMDPNSSRPFCSLGHLYKIGEGDFNRARKCYQKAFELDNSDEEAAKELCATEHVDDVVTILKQLVAVAPRCFWAWQKLGFSQLEKGEFQDSMSSLQTALRLSVNDVPCWEGLGEAYTKTGKHLAALKAFRRCIELDPLSVLAWYHMARTQSRLGMYAEAVRSFNRLLEKHPNDEALRLPVWKGICEAQLLQSREYKTTGFYGRSVDCLFSVLDLAAKGIAVNSNCLACWKLVSEGLLELLYYEEAHLAAGRDKALSLLVLSDSNIESLMGFDETASGPRTNGAIDSIIFCGLKATKMAIKLAVMKKLPTDVFWWYLSLMYHARKKVSGAGENDIKGDTLLAIRCIQTALEADPENATYWNVLGILTSNVDAMVAQHCFIKAIEVDSSKVSYYVTTWFVFRFVGQPKLVQFGSFLPFKKRSRTRQPVLYLIADVGSGKSLLLDRAVPSCGAF